MGDTLGTIAKLATGPMGMASAAGLGGEKLLGLNDGSGAPQAPDFVEAAREQSRLSHADQRNPFMRSQWSQGPDGRWHQNVSLEGGLGTAAEGLQRQVADLQTPMDWSQFGKAQTGDQAREQAITAAYNQAQSRLDPQWQQREQALQSRLANQGLSFMDEAGQSALGTFGRDRNDAYTSAMASAIGQGTAAGDVAFRNNMLARQMDIADALRARQLPLDELERLQNFTRGAQSPGPASGPDLQGAMNSQYQGELNRYNADQASKNSQLSGLYKFAPLLIAGGGGGGAAAAGGSAAARWI